LNVCLLQRVLPSQERHPHRHHAAAKQQLSGAQARRAGQRCRSARTHTASASSAVSSAGRRQVCAGHALLKLGKSGVPVLELHEADARSGGYRPPRLLPPLALPDRELHGSLKVDGFAKRWGWEAVDGGLVRVRGPEEGFCAAFGREGEPGNRWRVCLAISASIVAVTPMRPPAR
jgi:hypothetical protein